MTRFFMRMCADEEGATMVEYALMAALIAAALVTTVTALSSAIGTELGTVTTALGGGGS